MSTNSFFFCAIPIFSLHTELDVYECQQLQNSNMTIKCAERHWRGNKKNHFWRVHWFFFFYSAISAPLRILRFLSVNSSFFTVRVHANSLFRSVFFSRICITIRMRGRRAIERNGRQKEKENEHWVLDSNIILLFEKNCRIYVYVQQKWVQCRNWQF